MENKLIGGFALGLAVMAVVSLIIFGIVTAVQSHSSDIPKLEQTYIGNDVYRFVDEEAGVVCWTYKVWETLTCLPIKDTLLKH